MFSLLVHAMDELVYSVSVHYFAYNGYGEEGLCALQQVPVVFLMLRVLRPQIALIYFYLAQRSQSLLPRRPVLLDGALQTFILTGFILNLSAFFTWNITSSVNLLVLAGRRAFTVGSTGDDAGSVFLAKSSQASACITQFTCPFGEPLCTRLSCRTP